MTHPVFLRIETKCSGTVLINIDDITLIDTDNSSKLATIHTNKKSYDTFLRFSKLEEMLNFAYKETQKK